MPRTLLNAESSAWVRYPAACLIFLLALLLRVALLPPATEPAYVTFYPAMMVCLLLCGAGPGALMLLASAVSGYLFFTPLRGPAGIDLERGLSTAVYLSAGLALLLVIRRLHSYSARVEAYSRELRGAHEAVSASQRQLLAVTDNVPLSIVYFDAKEYVQFSNREFRNVIARGRPTDGLTVRDYLGETLYADSQAARRQAFAGERVKFLVSWAVDGRNRRREVTYIPDRDAAGTVVGLYGLSYDVTDHEQLTAELLQARMDLEAILNSVPARITSWHTDYTNRFANRSAETQFGVAAGHAPGRHARELLGEERFRIASPYIAAALAGARQSHEQHDRQADGSLRFSQVDYWPEWRDGRVVGLYALAIDITDLRDSRERIRDLVQRVETVREEEREAIARALHEGILQDLITAAFSLKLSNVESQGALGRTPAYGRFTQSIEHCIRLIRSMVHDLRPTTLAMLPLSATLREHARSIGARSGLDISVDDGLPLPMCDETTRVVMFRVAQEALANVVRHARATRVDIVLRADAEHLTMDISDDGIGIRSEELTKSGAFGLLEVNERITALGGVLRVESRETAEMRPGTRFVVRIPSALPGA